MHEDLFTDRDLEKLMKIRILLKQMQEKAAKLSYSSDAPTHNIYGCGIVSQQCEVAEDAVFQVVNNLNSYLDRDVPDHLMFPRSYKEYKDGAKA